jgi:hypothetical protein
MGTRSHRPVPPMGRGRHARLGPAATRPNARSGPEALLITRGVLVRPSHSPTCGRARRSGYQRPGSCHTMGSSCGEAEPRRRRSSSRARAGIVVHAWSRGPRWSNGVRSRGRRVRERMSPAGEGSPPPVTATTEGDFRHQPDRRRDVRRWEMRTGRRQVRSPVEPTRRSSCTSPIYVIRVMPAGGNPAQTGRMDNPEILRPRLERALARRDAAAPYGPEWAAAMEELDELRARARRAILARTDDRIAVSA